MYSFKELMITPVESGEDEYLKYRAMKRRKHMYEETAVEEESTDEALSMQSRMKRSRDMRKNKNKLAIARKRMAKRVANPERIKKRARKQARDMIYKKLTKGIPRSDLTPAKKRELEKRIDKMKPRVNRLTRKIMPQVRQRAHGK
jgi:hypothetical protein